MFAFFPLIDLFRTATYDTRLNRLFFCQLGLPDHLLRLDFGPHLSLWSVGFRFLCVTQPRVHLLEMFLGAVDGNR